MTTNTTSPRSGPDRTSEIFHGESSAGSFETSKAAGPSVHDQRFTAADVRETRGPVALLLDHRSASWIAIQRAIAMSDALGAKLHVVLAIPKGSTARHPALVASHVADVLETNAPHRGFELDVVEGPIEQLGSRTAHDIDAILVIVNARFGAKHACRLADDLGVPVLVARDEKREGEWIAASDMQHLKYPVLSAARDLARALEREVVYFHNARPIPVFVGDPMVGAATYAGMLKLQDDAAAAKRSRLQHLAARERDLHSFVSRSGNTVDALLDLARDRDADMVVVGHHRRSWFGRLFGRGTAEQIINRCRRSVLIVPLAGGRDG